MFKFQGTCSAQKRENLGFRRAEVIYQEEKCPRLCISNDVIETDSGLRGHCEHTGTDVCHGYTVAPREDLSTP